jgi:hypothetical protein
MTGYDVHWTDLLTGDQRVTEIYLMNSGTPDLFAPTIAGACLGGVRDEGRVRIDAFEAKERTA